MQRPGTKLHSTSKILLSGISTEYMLDLYDIMYLISHLTATWKGMERLMDFGSSAMLLIMVSSESI